MQSAELIGPTLNSNAPDEEILIRFKSGDGAAFAELIRIYGGLIRHVVRGFWRGAYFEEEAMQEVWLQVYRKRAQVDPERLASLGAWLATLARRKCIDLKRRQARLPEGTADELESAAPPPAVVAEADQDALVESGEIRAALDEFKAGLRPGWREFFEDCFVGELDYADLSARLGISRLRCKYMKRVLLARARKNRRLAAVLGREPGQSR